MLGAVDLQDLPLVTAHNVHSAKTAQQLDRLAPVIRRDHPAGFHCTVHDDMEARGRDDRCGAWVAELGFEPFPVGVFDPVKAKRWSWVVRRDADELWRPVAGGICGFTLTDATVQRLIEADGLIVGKDVLTGEVVLCEENGVDPVIPQEAWDGECTHCGLCCASPRLATGAPCEMLAPGPPPGETDDLP